MNPWDKRYEGLSNEIEEALNQLRVAINGSAVSNNSLSPRGEDFKKLLTINPWEQNYSEAWENYFSKSND